MYTPYENKVNAKYAKNNRGGTNVLTYPLPKENNSIQTKILKSCKVGVWIEKYK